MSIFLRRNTESEAMSGFENDEVYVLINGELIKTEVPDDDETESEDNA